MICWLLHPSYNEEWQRFSSIKDARETFQDDAMEAIGRFGQSEESWGSAWVVLGQERPGGDVYPDRVFHYDLDLDQVRDETT